MPTFDHEIDIAAPIDDVFAWGINPDNWQRSTPSLTDLEVLEETEEGTRYRNTFKMLGRSVTSEELFTVDDEAKQTVSVFDDDEMSGEMRFDYTEIEAGTHIRLHGDIETGTSLFERAIQPVLTRYMNRQFRTTLQMMKDLIEAEAVTAEQSTTTA